MPMSEKFQRTVSAAVHAIELTYAPCYPQRFPTIDAAKLFVKALCDAAGFDYGLPAGYNLRASDPHSTVRLVKDRVCFLVAIRAHEQGEFHLDEGLPDRKSLRDAVEAEIPRLTALVQVWPTTFASADVAAKYVAGLAALRGYEYARFEGVGEGKFQAYATWNTARRAWERKSFEMDRVPREWKRGAEKTTKVGDEAKTMTDAIEADIARLSTLMPREVWPTTFSDLNAAKNFVGQWCYETKFKYAGWPDVELRKYRLFVNFNAAKYALEAHVFEVEHAVPSLSKSHAKELDIPKDDVEATKVKASAHEKSVSTPIYRAVTPNYNHPHDRRLVNGTSSTSSSRLAATSLSSNEVDVQGVAVASAAPNCEKETAPVDPFKDLIAELQRGYILKAAFE